MSTIDSTTQATAVGVGLKNVSLAISGENLTRKIGIVATYDPAITTVTDEKEQLILSPEDAGSRYGFGYPMHRQVEFAFRGTNGAGEVYAIPQSEAGGAVASDGQIAWSGSVTKSGTIRLRIANELTSISIPNATTLEGVSDAVVAAVNLIAGTPVNATKTAVTFETVFTAKGKGPEGNNITISLNTGPNEADEFPTSLLGAVTDMDNGAGVPDIQDALDGLGTGDDSNGNYLTHLVHGYGIDTSTIDKISAYVGEGNDFSGCYDKLVGRPFVSLNCDTDPGSAALTALIAITDARKDDRANGILGIPDAPDNPTEQAAYTVGIMARIAQNNPAQHYAGIILSGTGAGDSADRWTKDLSGRDTAAKSGISPTRAVSEQVVLQNIVTFYRPVTVPTGSNGYKSMRSIAVNQDILFKTRQAFEVEDWQGISIVKDKSRVIDTTAAEKARDRLDVIGVLDQLADFFESKSWIFDAEFSKLNSEVAIRALSNGFDINFKYRISGESQIYNAQLSFDTNISGAA